MTLSKRHGEELGNATESSTEEPAATAPEEPSTEEPDTSPATETEGTQETSSPTAQEPDFKQAWDDWTAGRHDKVPANLRTHFAQVSAEAAERAQTQVVQDQQFRDLYLSYLAMQEEHPTEFNELIMDRTPGTTGRPKGLEVQEFMAQFGASNPDVTLENPDAPTNKRGDVRAAAIREVTTHIDNAVEAMSKEFELTSDQVDAAYKESKGDLASFLQASVRMAAEKLTEAEVAKKTPQIERANREAAELEAQAKITAGAPAAARRFASAPGEQAKKRSKDPMTAAFQTAKEIVER